MYWTKIFIDNRKTLTKLTLLKYDFKILDHIFSSALNHENVLDKVIIDFSKDESMQVNLI